MNVVDQAAESLAAMQAEDDAVIEEDWMARKKPLNKDGTPQYRGLLQILAEREE